MVCFLLKAFLNGNVAYCEQQPGDKKISTNVLETS